MTGLSVLATPSDIRVMNPATEHHTTGRSASSESYDAISISDKSIELQKVLDVALGLLRNGMSDVTRYEIQQAYNRLHTPSQSDGWISARVAMLLKQGRLVETGNSRINPVSQRKNSTLVAPVRQARLVA